MWTVELPQPIAGQTHRRVHAVTVLPASVEVAFELGVLDDAGEFAEPLYPSVARRLIPADAENLPDIAAFVAAVLAVLDVRETAAVAEREERIRPPREP